MIEISFTSSAPKFNIHLQDENLAPALHLIERWYEGDESFTFYSSGSTGTPKPVVLKREFLIASAKRTIQLFSISSNDTLLLALNTSFMGGMMMVIRAIIAQCNLIYIPPNKLNSDILRKLPEIKLASFVPVQVNDLLSQKINPFVKIRNILLGGAPISSDLENKIHELESYSLFYHTYGMTETASHVAIREIKNNNSIYHALNGFSFTKNEHDCLIIHDTSIIPHTTWETNDIVALLSSNSFEWIGRIDWVVNSGGIKFSLEKAEESIADFFQQRSINNAFTSYKIPDKTYGEKWILIIAGKDNTIDTSELKSYCKKRLGKYIYPKEILFSNRLAYLPSGKIDRLNSYKEALKL